MNIDKISSLLGILLMIIGAAMLLPLVWVFYYHEPSWYAFALPGAFTAGVGLFLYRSELYTIFVLLMPSFWRK